MSQSGPGLQADFSLEEATEDQEVRAAVRAIPLFTVPRAHFCAKVRLHDDDARTVFQMQAAMIASQADGKSLHKTRAKLAASSAESPDCPSPGYARHAAYVR